MNLIKNFKQTVKSKMRALFNERSQRAVKQKIQTLTQLHADMASDESDFSYDDFGNIRSLARELIDLHETQPLEKEDLQKVYLILGDAYQRKDMQEKANLALLKSIDIAPESSTSAQAHWKIGEIHSKDPSQSHYDPEQAILHYSKAVSISPDIQKRSLYYALLSNLYGAQGNVETAKEYLIKADESFLQETVETVKTPKQFSGGHMADVYWKRGYAFYRKGETGKSIESFKNATKISPQDDMPSLRAAYDSLASLGEIYGNPANTAFFDIKKSISYFEKAIKLSFGKEQDRYKKRLNTIKNLDQGDLRIVYSYAPSS